MSKFMRKITYYENILEFKENTKEKLNLSEINNWNLCRTCLADTCENDVNIENMSIIDIMQGTFLNLKQMIIDTTKIKISTTGNLPVQVCNECFGKITQLYYFSIQVRKAETILNRLVNEMKSCQDVSLPSETDVENISCISNTSTDENKTYKETLELFEEMSDSEARLIDDENAATVNAEEEYLIKDEVLVSLKEVEDHTVIKLSSADDEGHLETDLFENSYIDDGETNVSYRLKEPKKSARRHRNASNGSTGYRHKQPRVTSPLLNDFDCAICQISFSRQQDLVQHVRASHPNSKAYKCRVCGNLFSHLQSLSRHMNSHKESVILKKCEYCSKSFVRVDDLKRHLRIHTGERPYICSICKNSFQRKSILKYHQRKHIYDDVNLKPKLFECTQCNRSYTSRAGLNWHKKKLHGEDSNIQELKMHYSLCDVSFHKESDKCYSEKEFCEKLKRKVCNKMNEEKHHINGHQAEEVSDKENEADITAIENENLK